MRLMEGGSIAPLILGRGWPQESQINRVEINNAAQFSRIHDVYGIATIFLRMANDG
jgi:hypothetical protein